MKLHPGSQTLYELHCNACRVTFPAGTRRCIHCGGPVGVRSEPGSAQTTLLATGEALSEEEAPPEFAWSKHLGGLSLWVLLALGAVLSRMCSG
ncbi:MAG: hypothetical protein OEM49_03785 [Myxococcales bacterium]|nr:hypothetical protein [Myxococcales bacterium]MDH5306694.1 hypothetical protein [Myxococcales bacterium]MDH5565781.1 hypothetical protein [Myxococcales bacterium]